MILALEVVVAVMGLYMLATGNIPLSGYGSREGLAVRIAGLLFLLPIPIGFCARYAMGLPMFGSPPQNSLVPGTSRTEADMWTLSLIELGVTFGIIAVGTLVIFLGAARPSAYRRSTRPPDGPPGN